MRYAPIVSLALAMGVQNSSVRRLAVPDLTTTVLTLTVTGIGADSALGGGNGSKSGRRLISVAAMFLGALAGAALILHVPVAVPLILALAIVAVVAVASHWSGRSNPAWTRVGGGLNALGGWRGGGRGQQREGELRGRRLSEAGPRPGDTKS